MRVNSVESLYPTGSRSLFLPSSNRRNYDPRGKRTTLADRYDYVMYGKVYKVDEERDKYVVYASYGGLLMMLRGDKSNLEVCMHLPAEC